MSKLRPPTSKLGGDAASPALRADREALDAIPLKIEKIRAAAAARFEAASARIESERKRFESAQFPPDLIRRNIAQVEERETKIARQEAEALLREGLKELQPYKLGLSNASVPFADKRRQFLIHATQPESAPHTAALLAIVDRLGPEALARYAQTVIDMSGSDDPAAMRRVLPLAHAIVSKLESYPMVDSRPVSLGEFMDHFSWPTFDNEKARLDGLAKAIGDFEKDAADLIREGKRSSRNLIERGLDGGQHRRDQQGRGDGVSRLPPGSPTAKIAEALKDRQAAEELI